MKLFLLILLFSVAMAIPINDVTPDDDVITDDEMTQQFLSDDIVYDIVSFLDNNLISCIHLNFFRLKVFKTE